MARGSLGRVSVISLDRIGGSPSLRGRLSGLAAFVRTPERRSGYDASGCYVRALIAYPDPPLVTRGVALRQWDRCDLPLVEKASADADLLAGTTLPDPFTDADGLAYIERQWSRAERGAGLSLAIEERVAASAVGATSLMLRRPGIADLGYWLVRAARGRGLGRKTVGLIVPWALQQMPIEAIEAFVEPENEPSRRILDVCGFTLMGSRRHKTGRLDAELLVYRCDR